MSSQWARYNLPTFILFALITFDKHLKGVSASSSVLPLSHVLNKPKSQPLFGCDRKAMKIHHENRSLWLLRFPAARPVNTSRRTQRGGRNLPCCHRFIPVGGGFSCISSASSVGSKLGNSINGCVCHWSSSKNVVLTQTLNPKTHQPSIGNDSWFYYNSLFIPSGELT